ncbi:hypothetical protein HDF16_005237 [Granulicella aggregans]|uniref:Uncharacterized protein n=1 Tax=Granulicella aggregans TaxID=474949 RepID=A0A7W7ZIJ6_9BACT|nr:hypothetical protein [Granulicella aggregans]
MTVDKSPYVKASRFPLGDRLGGTFRQNFKQLQRSDNGGSFRLTYDDPTKQHSIKKVASDSE